MADYGEDLLAAVHTRLETVTSLPAIRSWDNEAFQRPAKASFVVDRIITFDTDYRELGAGAWRRSDVTVQVSVYTPTGASNSAGLRIATDIETAFQNGAELLVSGDYPATFRDSRKGPAVVDGPHNHMPVYMSFDFDHP